MNPRGRKFDSPREVREAHEKAGRPAGFCLAPFTTLLLEPDGQVGGCRHKGAEHPVGHITHQSLTEIWNGPFIRQWRREFLSGDVRTCRAEVKHRACHLCPDYNSLLDDAALTEVQTRPPLRLGLNFNGQCNLTCTMCHIWQKPNGLYDRIGFWDELAELAPNLREVELLSGEPFIQKDTYRLIDLFREKNPACRWTITTNVQWKLTDKIRAALDHIEIKNLIVSLDSVNPETYAKIRVGGELARALRTLADLRAYEQERISRGRSPLSIRVNFLVQRDNWRELGEMYHFSQTEGVESFRTFLYEPPELSLLSFSESERERAIEYYLRELPPAVLRHSMRVLVPVLESLSPIARADFYARLRELTPAAERPA